MKNQAIPSFFEGDNRSVTCSIARVGQWPVCFGDRSIVAKEEKLFRFPVEILWVNVVSGTNRCLSAGNFREMGGLEEKSVYWQACPGRRSYFLMAETISIIGRRNSFFMPGYVEHGFIRPGFDESGNGETRPDQAIDVSRQGLVEFGDL